MRQPRPRGAAWRRVAALAAEQHGVVAYTQLIDLEISASAIQRAAADGFLTPLHRGVFAFGHARLRTEGRWMAAVLAPGPDGALTHTDALVLRGIVRSNAPRIHVTVPRLTGGAHRRSGLVIHRCKLEPQDRDVVDGIPTTTVARALLDFAEIARPRQLERALDEAEKQQLLDLHAVLDVLERARGRRGLKRLRRTLDLYVPEPHRTNSWLERHMLGLIREAGLPMPDVNVHLNGHEVDLHWPHHGLVVELDSRRHHDTAWAREEDKARDAGQTARGHSVVRLTYRRITREPQAVIAELSDSLAIRAPARRAA
jgi:predicted transcriptional regulator of viral defense system